MKKCKECNKLLNFSCFGKHSKSKDGYEYRCKECKNRLQREYRRKNNDVVIKQRRKYYLKERKNPERILKHIWNSMVRRCNDKSNSMYGGRGIQVEWDNYELFRDDMLDLFIEGLRTGNKTIDRIDNDKNYSKEKANSTFNTEDHFGWHGKNFLNTHELMNLKYH